MRTLIIEDEQPAVNRLKRMLRSVAPEVNVQGVCNSISSAVEWLESNTAPELILSDIELADGRSFEIFARANVTSSVVFITAYDQFAIKAIKLNALDYLLKPVKVTELAQAIQKAKKRATSVTVNELSGLEKQVSSMAIGTKPKRLAISTVESIRFVELDKIVRFEADSNYTHIYLTDKSYITASRTLKEYDELLSDFGFFRVTKKHMINLQHIEKLLKTDGGYVLMTDGSTMEIAGSRKKELLGLVAIQ